MEIKYLKSAARLLKKVYVIWQGLDLSKEVIWVSVGQRAAELQAVKVRDEIKICHSTRRRQSRYELD